MKTRTSVTLSAETLRAIDELAADHSKRSQVIEMAVIEFLARREKEQREARDREILDRTANALNLEVEDVLTFLVDP